MATLPRGPLTLLFTDIEGSTRLVDALGDRYGSVLRAHRRIIRRAVVEAGGHEVDCRADEFFVVFAEPAAAVAAASAAQQALAAHAWPPGHPVRVRMGVHTGRPTRVRDDYIGVDVHRAARVCAAAHGGQVFLSAAVCDALGDTASSLRDLGEHLLRGLPAPERLFQLIVPGLPLGPAPVGEAAREGPRTRVVLADDSVLLREGIGRLLEDAGFEVAAQSGTADDLLRDVAAHAPDVAIVDLRMPPTHTDEGLQAAKEIRRCHPGVGVLVLSQFVEPAYARELLGTGTEGVGYLLKDRVADVAEFAAAVRCVAEGGSALDPTLPSL
jgi:class 3 adenylate cyclase/CheY-like chemotaxis protein